jgi:hypothetical protein
MGWTGHVALVRERRGVYIFCGENYGRRPRRRWNDIKTDLKGERENDRSWTGIIWSGMWTTGEFLSTLRRTSGLYKCRKFID